MDNTPYAAPLSDVGPGAGEAPVYVGFWARVGASLIDTVIIMVVSVPLLVIVYGWDYFGSQKFLHGGWDFFVSYVLPAVVVIVFWVYRAATPGKMAVSAKIVDAKTGGKPTVAQWVIRYIGYFVSTLVLLLGFIWVAFDKRKQGWHDKMAGTVVVKAV